MKKKIIRLTESDLENLVKKILSEVGGYDDPYIMSRHYSIIIGVIKEAMTSVLTMLERLNMVLNSETKMSPENKSKIIKSLTALSGAIDETVNAFNQLKNEITEKELYVQIMNFSKFISKFNRKLRTLQTVGYEMPYTEFKVKVITISRDLIDSIFETELIESIEKVDKRFVERFKNL